MACATRSCRLTGDQDACAAVVDEVGALGLELDGLVNNAGFGIDSAFATSDLERECGSSRS